MRCPSLSKWFVEFHFHCLPTREKEDLCICYLDQPWWPLLSLQSFNFAIILLPLARQDRFVNF